MTLCLLTLTTAIAFPPSGGDDWPRFQGPDGTGKAELSGVSFDWPEDGPAVHWVAPTGPGYGGVSVRDGEVYLLDREVGGGGHPARPRAGDRR